MSQPHDAPLPGEDAGTGPATRRAPVVRAGWICLGSLCVGLGGIGVVVPGLPTTIFFIIAAWAFAKSSPRLEAWVLGLPRVGPMVVDYRAGLGMPRRSKRLAIGTIVVFVGLSLLLIDSWTIRGVVIAAAFVGVGVIVIHVPTREDVAGADPAARP